MRAELVAFDIGKVEILQYYGGRAGQYIATAFNFNPCHGLSTFLVELVVFDMGKVEISQYYLTRLRTEKSKYHTYARPCHGLSHFSSGISCL